MIRSMTGFGRGGAQGDGKEFLVEIKTVNHRYSDLFIKMPRQISFLEDKVREEISKIIFRGKIDVYITYNDFSENSKNVLLDESLVKAYLNALELLRDKYGIRDDIAISLISRLPDVMKVEVVEGDQEKLWQLLKAALDEALQSLVAMREAEGCELKNNLLEKADYMEKIIGEIALRAPEVVKEYKQKLENRIKELLDQQNIDENRIVMEAAIFAERCSIDEELTRLGSHISQMRETLGMDQPVGRKLDFLVQEMNREINTIGSKANDLSIARHVIELKSEVEKIREQVQNIE